MELRLNHMSIVTEVVKGMSDAELAVNAYWRINKIWRGRAKPCSVGHALSTLNNARRLIGPHRPIHGKICRLIDDIVHNQAESAPAEATSQNAS